jgi:hypothetical protein
VGRGEGFDHLPVRCAPAFPAEMSLNSGFGNVCTDIGVGVATDADLSRVVITPQPGVLGTERTVAVVYIIGPAGNRDAYRTAVASPFV